MARALAKRPKYESLSRRGTKGTVKTHLEHAYAKTGLRNRAELAAAVTQHKHEQP